MSSQGDGKYVKRDPYVKDGEKPKKEEKVQLYIVQHMKFSTEAGHPVYYSYSDFSWVSDIDKATRMEGKDDPRLPEYGRENFEFILVER